MSAAPIDHSHRRYREPESRRTFAKVKRGSKLAGREDWPHFSWAQGRKLMLALRIHAEKLRRKGQRTGAAPRPGELGGISFGALKLAETLVNIAAKRNGRLFPSAETLAEMMNVPMKSIHAWKAQLKRHGFLDWTRRYVETGRDGVRGPQVAQTSNAYWLRTPPQALAEAERRLGPPPSLTDREEALRRQESPLMASLDRLGAAVQDNAGLTGPHLRPT